MSELTVLQTVRLKGRVQRSELADMSETVDQLIAAGLLIDATTLRISPDGRAKLAELLAEERAAADPTVLTAAYNDFRSVNGDFKKLVTDWQLKDGAPNAHDDADYDAAVLARLESVHERVQPIVNTAAEQLPRLGSYATKLRAALDKTKAGDTAWLTRPLIDSYHTVWFELHEELILSVGLTREQAARSGDAQ